MGIFDRFRKPKQTAAPAAAGPPPAVPATATIATYVVADAIGMLELANRGQLQFGRSACKGFEPVVGARVIVEEVASDARGWKARVVKLDPDDASYDELRSGRDAAQGFRDPVMAPEEAAATARQLGIATVLLREPLPVGHHALRTWASAIGLPHGGFDIRVERDLELVIPGGTVLTYPGRAPFPAAGLDTRNVGDAFDLGRSFLGLGMGLPGVGRQLRAMAGARDPWAPDGALRELSRLIQLLASAATGVVLHRAGEVVVPIGDFLRALGELGDPGCRPFGAWLDVGITRRDDAALYGAFGMAVFGLPDVLAEVDPHDRWSRSRCHEAVLYACYRMIRENRELRPGETLEVPVRIAIGAWPAEIGERDATTTYEVREQGDDLMLALTREPDVTGELAVNLYQALLDRGLNHLVPSQIARDVPARSGRPIEHRVEVRARADDRGFLIVTNGFGLRLGHEVGAWVPLEAFELVKLVGALGGAALEAHERWKPCDIVNAQIDELGIGGFVLADGGTIDMGSAPSVALLLVVPLADTDYARVRGGGAAAWLARHPPTELSWTPFVGTLTDRD